jgi:hypothetical protein
VGQQDLPCGSKQRGFGATCASGRGCSRGALVSVTTRFDELESGIGGTEQEPQAKKRPHPSSVQVESMACTRTVDSEPVANKVRGSGGL